MMTKESLQKTFSTVFIDSHDNWKGNCPFHDERSPSFFVHKDNYIANCFGCGKHGYIDNLAAEYLGVSLGEARTALGITAQERIERRSLFGSSANRSVDPSPRVFPESWLAPFRKEVSKYVLARKFQPNILASAGSLYDPVLKRQLFPHRDREGRLLGVIGRACKGQDPKWYFYWDYRKGQALYKPFRTTTLRPILVVEGVFDLLWLKQNGVDNVVALIGSKPTRHQIRELRGLSKEIILGLDNDEAGRAGSKIVEQALRCSSIVRTVDWPAEVNDWMDLDKDQIGSVISSSRTELQKKLIANNVHRQSLSSTETDGREALQS